jgi:hypothetical protein
MSELQQESQHMESPVLPLETPSGDMVVVQVVCDDKQVSFAVSGHETLGQIKREAIREMEILTATPERYVVIGPNRQPVGDDLTVGGLVAEGQELSLRLLARPAFGNIEGLHHA